LEPIAEAMEIGQKGPPENDFVNFQLGEFMFGVEVFTRSCKNVKPTLIGLNIIFVMSVL
jgi:hypothetical protein